MTSPSAPYLYVSPIGLPEEVGFNPHADFSGCKLCGAVYQSDLDRKVANRHATPGESIQATVQRKNWTLHHAKTHSDKEHAALASSGRFCTPEAAYKLASYGIIGIPLVGDDETTDAQANAKRLPADSPTGEAKGGSTIQIQATKG